MLNRYLSISILWVAFLFSSMANADKAPFSARITVLNGITGLTLQKVDLIVSEHQSRISPVNTSGPHEPTVIVNEETGTMQLLNDRSKTYTTIVMPDDDLSENNDKPGRGSKHSGLLSDIPCADEGKAFPVSAVLPEPRGYTLPIGSTISHGPDTTYWECRNSHDILLSRHTYSTTLGLVIQIEHPSGVIEILTDYQLVQLNAEHFQVPADYEEKTVEHFFLP
jgi:hypothetical protein